MWRTVAVAEWHTMQSWHAKMSWTAVLFLAAGGLLRAAEGAEPAPGSADRYVALFNTRDKPAAPADLPGVPVSVKLSELGFDVACRICDLWQPKDLGEFTGEFAPEIPWHGAGLYRVSPARK